MADPLPVANAALIPPGPVPTESTGTPLPDANPDVARAQAALAAQNAAPATPATTPDPAADIKRAQDALYTQYGSGNPSPDMMRAHDYFQTQVDDLSKKGSPPQITRFFHDNSDALTSAQVSQLGDAYLKNTSGVHASDVLNSGWDLIKSLHHFAGFVTGATTAGNIAGQVSSGVPRGQANMKGFIQSAAEGWRGLEDLEAQSYQLGSSLVTLGTRAMASAPRLAPAMGSPAAQSGGFVKNPEANLMDLLTGHIKEFEAPRNGVKEMMDSAGILNQSEKILNGSGFYGKVIPALSPATLAKEGITPDPAMAEDIATGGFLGITSLFSGLRAVEVPAAVGKRVWIVNEANDVVAKAVSPEAAQLFIPKASDIVGQGMATLAGGLLRGAGKGLNVAGNLTGIIGAAPANLMKKGVQSLILPDEFKTWLKSRATEPELTAGQKAKQALTAPLGKVDLQRSLKALMPSAAEGVGMLLHPPATIPIIAGSLLEAIGSPMLKAAGAVATKIGRPLGTEVAGNVAGKMVAGGARGVAAGAPFSVAGNENDPTAAITQALMFGSLGAAGGAVGGVANELNRMSQIAHGEILPKVQPIPNTRVVGTAPNLGRFENAHQQTMDKLDQFNPLRAALTNAQKDLLQTKGEPWYVFTAQQAADLGLPDAEGAYHQKVTGENGQPETISFSVLRNDDVMAGDHEPGHAVVNFAKTATPDAWSAFINAIPAATKSEFEAAYRKRAAGSPEVEAASTKPGYFDDELGAELLGKYLSDSLHGVPEVTSKLHTLIGTVMDKLGLAGPYVGSTAEGATKGFGMVPSAKAAAIAQAIVSKFKASKPGEAGAKPVGVSGEAHEIPAATTGLSPEHENVLAGLSKVMGAKGMLKLNAVAEKVRAGQPLTEDEQTAWRGVDEAAVKAGAKSVGLGGKAPETPAPTPGAPTPEPTPGAPKARNPEIGEKRIEAAKNISQAVEETGSEPLKALAAGGAHEVEYSHAEGEKEGQVQRHEAVNTPEARARTTGEVLRTKVTLLDALKTKAGDWVARLFNHDVFGQNLAVAVKAIKKANLENRVPYTLGDRGIVGEADQARFKDDLRKYTENQHNGYRGDGGTLIRPVGGKSFIPEETPGYTPQPLSDPRASDFLNLLMGERPPKTTRGGAAHLEHQDIAKLNAGPVHPIPGLEYAGANAGRSVANTTNLRNDLMQAGADVSDMKPVHEDKRVDRITAATPVAGEAKVAAPVVATTAAGFMPAESTKLRIPEGRFWIDKDGLATPLRGSLLNDVRNAGQILGIDPDAEPELVKRLQKEKQFVSAVRANDNILYVKGELPAFKDLTSAQQSTIAQYHNSNPQIEVAYNDRLLPEFLSRSIARRVVRALNRVGFFEKISPALGHSVEAIKSEWEDIIHGVKENLSEWDPNLSPADRTAFVQKTFDRLAAIKQLPARTAEALRDWLGEKIYTAQHLIGAGREIQKPFLTQSALEHVDWGAAATEMAATAPKELISNLGGRDVIHLAARYMESFISRNPPEDSQLVSRNRAFPLLDQLLGAGDFKPDKPYPSFNSLPGKIQRVLPELLKYGREQLQDRGLNPADLTGEAGNSAFLPRLSDVPENERGPGKEVTIRRADGTEYQAMSIGKVDNREWVGRATENRKVSHGLLGKGETIVENPAFMPTAVKSYADAPKDRTQNPYVRLTDAADNSGRSLMVQFSSDLLYKGAAQDDAPAGYYDKLYSGARKGYARMDDFWEIPQWVGFAAKIWPESDFYVVRDMAKAKEFLDKAGYDHLLFSALDVNRDVIKEIAEAVHTPVEVGGYTDKNFFKDVKNVTWHDTMESMAKKTGSSYVQGVDYRHFKGASVIPRLTMSTGCKYQCAFCSIEKTVVPSSDEFVNQQADAIAGLGSQLVYLNDKTFGQSANYATLPEVGERIKAKNPNFKGFVIQTTAPVFSKFDPAWLKKSGIRYVELGIESYNDPILRSVNKPATEATMDRAAQVARENNIALIPNVIIGLPGETAETYAHTLSYLKANEDIISHANIYNLAIYKNTKLGKSLTTASPDDFNENVLEKSFHNDQQVHRVFAGDLYGTANKLLDKTPPGANYMPKANYLDSKDDFLREVVGDRMHYVPLNSTFTDNKGGSFMPAKNESKEANEGTTGWLLPDHTFRALAPSPNAGHEGYLAEHTEELNKKFGTSFDANTVNDENARVDALNKGFVRWRNYGGALAVEANERYWGGQRNSILKRLVNAQDEFSHLKINVLTDGGKWLAGNSVNLLTVPDKESAIREAVQGVMIPEGTPVNPEPTLIQRARALPGEEGMPAFMPSTKPGAIVSAASRDNNTGKIYTGTWHGDANLKYMRQRFPDDSEDINNLRAVAAIDDPHYPLTAGFVTNKGEFLNRTEAYDRAIQLKQASPENYVNKELESARFNKETARNPEAFLPKTEAGRDLEKRGFLFSEEDYGGGTLVFHINRPGLPEPIARMTVIQHDPNTAHVASVFTAPAYRGQRLAETLYRELGARLQNLGIGKLTGRVIHEAPLRIRTKLFGPATADEVTPLPGAEGVQAHYITHPVSPVTKFMPAEQKMKDMNMYVVRHGETILNAEGKMRGWNNPPLNSAGLKEAQNAAEQLTGHGIRRIATSDLQRAHQTANIIGKHLGVPVEVDRGLRPWGFGPKIEDMLSEKAAPIVERLVAHPDQRPEGIYSNGEHPESFNEYRHRIFSTLERLHQENPDGKTAVVTHYRTMKALEARTVGHEIAPEKFSERGEDRPGSLAYVRNGVLRHGLPRYLPVKAVKGLIGQTDENSLEGDPVQAKEFRNLRSSSAEHELWFGDASPEGEVARWRYVPDTQTLYWWFKNDVSSKAREMTREYLKDHGYDVKLERDVESNFDAAHGFMPKVRNPKAAPPEIEEFKNLKTMPDAFNKPNWAIVTATREMWGSATSDQNMRATDKLEGELFGRGFNYVPVSGSYKGEGQGKSFLISGITPQQALDLGRDYGQESVLVPQGYLYHDGTLAPVDPQNTVIGPAAQKQDGWSQVKGGEPFSLGINFAKRVPSGLEQSKPVQTGLFGDEEGEKVRLRNMSPKQLVAKYPEIVKPKLTESGKLQQVPYDLEEGTNFKGLKTREEKVKYVSDKLVAEASRLEKTPEFQDGLHWYSEFVPKLKKWFGKHAQIFAELLAATSPQTNVGTNFLYARKAFEGWVKGDYDAKISKFNEGMEMAANGKLGNWYRHSVPEPIQERNPSRAAMIAAWVEEHDLLPTQPERASYEPFTGKKTKLEINFGLHGRRVLQVLARRWMAENQGLKVAQFVGNLTGKSHGATIDVWAARLLRRLAYDNAKPWRILPEQETAVSDSDFKFGQDAFALAAKKLNLKPNALQAALWFVEKRYWNNKGWGKLDFGDFRNELENFVTKKKYEAVQGDLLGGKDILPLTKVQSNVKLGHEAVQALPPEARDLFNVKG